jgi:NADH-quinone oxidoreductase subunit J
MSEFMTQSGLATPFGWLFYVGAAGAIIAALMMVFSKSPLRGALWLIASLCCVALLFMLLEASFVAAMQVLVYAGAIMVLFVFVIMLLNLGPDASVRPAYVSVAKVLGALGAGYFTFQIIMTTAGGGAGKPVDGSVKAVGTLLLSDFLFAFEAISVLLLVAVIGAVVLGLKRLT